MICPTVAKKWVLPICCIRGDKKTTRWFCFYYILGTSKQSEGDEKQRLSASIFIFIQKDIFLVLKQFYYAALLSIVLAWAKEYEKRLNKTVITNKQILFREHPLVFSRLKGRKTIVCIEAQAYFRPIKVH